MDEGRRVAEGPSNPSPNLPLPREDPQHGAMAGARKGLSQVDSVLYPSASSAPALSRGEGTNFGLSTAHRREGGRPAWVLALCQGVRGTEPQEDSLGRWQQPLCKERSQRIRSTGWPPPARPPEPTST